MALYLFSDPNSVNLTLSQTSPGFSSVYSESLLKTLREKEKLLVTSNFSFYYSVFYPFGELSAIFIKLSSANSLSLEEAEICRLGKGEGCTFCVLCEKDKISHANIVQSTG